VESATLVVQRLSALSNTLLTSAKSTEVFGGFGSLAEETHDDAAAFAACDFDVEEDLGSDGLASSDCANGKEKSGKEIHGDSLTRKGILEVDEEVIVLKSCSIDFNNDVPYRK